MKKFGKALLVLACIIGVTVAGVCLVMEKQIENMAQQLDAVPVAAPEQVADDISGSFATKMGREHRQRPCSRRCCAAIPAKWTPCPVRPCPARSSAPPCGTRWQRVSRIILFSNENGTRCEASFSFWRAGMERGVAALR